MAPAMDRVVAAPLWWRHILGHSPAPERPLVALEETCILASHRGHLAALCHDAPVRRSPAVVVNMVVGELVHTRAAADQVAYYASLARCGAVHLLMAVGFSCASGITGFMASAVSLEFAPARPRYWIRSGSSLLTWIGA